MSPQIDSAELVQRIRAGDREAESLLVQKYSRPLLTLIRCRVKDPDLADDLHQDTFQTVIQRLRTKGIDEPDKLAGFINRTAINLHIGWIRKAQRRKTSTNNEIVYNQSDDATGPLSTALQRESASAVRDLLAELPTPRDQDILRRFYVREEDKASICASLELSPEHFDRVISRARKRFRQIVESRAPELANRVQNNADSRG